MNDTIDDRMWNVVERVTRLETLIEAHSRDSAHFRETTNARLEDLGRDMRGISSKLDTIAHKITVTETQVKTGWTLLGFIGRHTPSIGFGGALTWIATHLWWGK